MTGDDAKVLLDEAKKHKALTPWEASFYKNVTNIGLWKLSAEQTAKVQQIYANSTGGGRKQRRVTV